MKRASRVMCDSVAAGVLIQTVVMTRAQAEQGPEQSSLLMLAVSEEGVPV